MKPALGWLALVALMAQPVMAQPRSPQPNPSPPPVAAAPAPDGETKPYDPQLLRLSEILGTLAFMRGLCGDADPEQWRARMQALLDAEGTTPARKARLAGAFNQGLEGYRLSYRTCTANAHAVIGRVLEEGEALAKAIENRYRAG